MIEIDYSKDYLYNEELEKLTEQINNVNKTFDEIESVTDLFHNGITCFGDILRLIKKLKEKGIKELEYRNNKYSLKRIYGLVNSADTYYEADSYCFNPKYPIASLLLNITSTLDRELYWEENYDKIDDLFL